MLHEVAQQQQLFLALQAAWINIQGQSSFREGRKIVGASRRTRCV
jgi:hypothetical protein